MNRAEAAAVNHALVGVELWELQREWQAWVEDQTPRRWRRVSRRFRHLHGLVMDGERLTDRVHPQRLFLERWRFILHRERPS